LCGLVQPGVQSEGSFLASAAPFIVRLILVCKRHLKPVVAVVVSKMKSVEAGGLMLEKGISLQSISFES
jgi:hypothetical protein